MKKGGVTEVCVYQWGMSANQTVQVCRTSEDHMVLELSLAEDHCSTTKHSTQDLITNNYRSNRLCRKITARRVI